MHASMDLNNEKILMRKEINRARLRIISKLVRQIKSLNNKKGNESQMEKNRRRAERLLKEVDILKEINKDQVFKQLINAPPGNNNTAMAQLSLEKRALFRIGSVSFIQSKIAEIRKNVSAFHKLRTGKEASLFHDTADSTDWELVLKKDESQDRQVCESKSTANRISDDHSSDGENNLPSNEASDRSLEGASNGNNLAVVKPIMNEPASETDEAISDDAAYEISLKTPPITASVSEPASKEDPEIREDISEESSDEEIAVKATAQTAIVAREKPKNLPDFAEIAEGHEDVTEILTNIGDGFDSDESRDEDEIEIEDIPKLKRKRDGSSRVQDAFFLDSTGAAAQNPASKTKETLRTSDDEDFARSCFVESLASVSHQRSKGKSRPSQRARKRFANKSERNSNPGPARVDKEAVVTNAKSSEDASLHPSWEASRKRKQEQSSLQEFKGKRVCFDDSD